MIYANHRMNPQEVKLGNCAGQLSITMTKHPDKQLIRTKGLFCVLVSEASVHGCLDLWWLSVLWQEHVHLMAATKQRERQE